jgi:hypothetical protein
MQLTIKKLKKDITIEKIQKGHAYDGDVYDEIKRQESGDVRTNFNQLEEGVIFTLPASPKMLLMVGSGYDHDNTFVIAGKDYFQGNSFCAGDSIRVHWLSEVNVVGRITNFKE